MILQGLLTFLPKQFPPFFYNSLFTRPLTPLHGPICGQHLDTCKELKLLKLHLTTAYSNSLCLLFVCIQLYIADLFNSVGYNMSLGILSGWCCQRKWDFWLLHYHRWMGDCYHLYLRSTKTESRSPPGFPSYGSWGQSPGFVSASQPLGDVVTEKVSHLPAHKDIVFSQWNKKMFG